MQFAIVIMAAGKGTRLKTKRPKVLHEVGGKTLLRHVVDAARQIVPPEDIYVVVGHQAELVKASLSGLGVQFIEQTEQRGTGHAIQEARPAVEGYADLIVLSGDVPLIRAETIRKIRDFHLERRAAMTVLTASPADLHGYGRVIRKSSTSDEIQEIVEAKALTPKLAQAREINSGIYAFTSQPLFTHIGSLGTQNAHGELYLTDMAAILTAAGERVLALEAENADEVLGANTIAEMMTIDDRLRLSIAHKLMAEGVTIFRPETSVIDANVVVGADTIIEPFVQLLGETKVGKECRIRYIGQPGACPPGLHHQPIPSTRWRLARPLCAYPPGERDRGGRSCGKLCRDQEDSFGQRVEGKPLELSGGRGNRRRRECGSRGHHLQL
jgi:bifunctional UDP-N-acetylglucosamine pyrophosphorylase/glucosamine-1-phosphate N-acetyltransferase